MTPKAHTHIPHYYVPTQTNTVALNLLAEMTDLFFCIHVQLVAVKEKPSWWGYCILIFLHDTDTHTHAPIELLAPADLKVGRYVTAGPV